MKIVGRTARTIFFVAAAVVGIRSAASSSAFSDSAPADEYFGPFGMSPLSIRLTIDRLADGYVKRYKSDPDIIHEAVDIENALYLWRYKYPNDPWLAPTAFHLEQLYQAVQTPEAHYRATALLHYIAANFPASKYAHLARVRLAAGFPALHDEPPLVPSANPYATPAAPEPVPTLLAPPPIADPSPPPAPSPPPPARKRGFFSR